MPIMSEVDISANLPRTDTVRDSRMVGDREVVGLEAPYRRAYQSTVDAQVGPSALLGSFS
jgi:hypothetical protein